MAFKNRHHTEETKKKISEKSKSQDHSWKIGRKASDETRRKLSASLKGKNTWSKGRTPWNKGKTGVYTEEQKQRMAKAYSLVMKGKPHNDEWNRKVALANTGKKHTKETKEKLRQSALKRLANKENHPNWKGGISFEPYSINWTDTLKQSIRERDKYTCKICGDRQGNRALDVHHINYIKEDCNPNNLITLCHKCHIKTNFNRDFWKKYFYERSYMSSL
jgi:hypothetical protein